MCPRYPPEKSASCSSAQHAFVLAVAVDAVPQSPSRHLAAASSSISMRAVVRFPLSVVKPAAASASFMVYGSSRRARTLSSVSTRSCPIQHRCAPPLVHLPLLMGDKVGVALKPLCALLAVPLAEPGQVLGGLGVLELGEVLVVVEVGVDLVEVACVAARLLLGLLAANGGHGCG
jgi:hypothetical protein